MKLSVIVPCWNAARTIEDAFRGLLRQTWPDEWEVILADNGSTDDLRHVVDRYKGQLPGLRIVDASARRGASQFKVNLRDPSMDSTRRGARSRTRTCTPRGCGF